MISISNNLLAVHKQINCIARKTNRASDSITLLAVSKTRGAECVREAAVAGQRAFGENYVQEGVEKIHALKDLELEWHFIGALQSNKTRIVAQYFDWVHSVDRLKMAERLSEQRDTRLKPLNICLQVNVSGEQSKSGIVPDMLMALAQKVAVLPRLRLRGLMCIPEPTDDPGLQQARFAHLAQLQRDLIASDLMLDTLSMGMSADLEAAIAEGATIVRVGTAIFGSRSKV